MFLLLAGCRSLQNNVSLDGNASERSVLNATSGQIAAIEALDLDPDASWRVQALDNRSANVTAAESAVSLLETHLLKRGVQLELSRNVAPEYQIEGRVDRWQYIGNAIAQPLIELSLNVRDVSIDQIVWQSSTQDEGRRGETLSGLADRMMGNLVSQIPLAVRTANSEKLNAPSAMDDKAVNSCDGSRMNQQRRDVYKSKRGTKEPLTEVPTNALGSVSLMEPSVTTQPALSGRSIAFYYGSSPPVTELRQFDRLVLEPDNIEASELQALTAKGSLAYAYLSVGEVGPERAYADELDSQWILGKNPAWKSDVLDLSNPQWRSFLVKRAGELKSAGYSGLFLDTMDSFNLIARTEQDRQQQQAGLVSLIADLSRQYPTFRIITNRGFEVIDRIAKYVEAVSAESLFCGWNNANQSYVPVSKNDRDWLMEKLLHVRNDLELEVIAIDYLPPSRRDEARGVALRIAELGFIPWVTNPELDYLGVGALEVVPRKVLLLYDSTVEPLEEHPVHRFVAMPLEYMGYVPEYLDIATQALPAGVLKGRYAGVLLWSVEQIADPAFKPWLLSMVEQSVPIVLMGQPPVDMDSTMSAALGIRVGSGLDLNSARLSYSDEYIQPERQLAKRVDSLSLAVRSVGAGNSVHMSIEDNNSQRADVVVTGPFGGYAWQPGLVQYGQDLQTYWVIDPFRFLRTALQLVDAPMPDVTTENGKRLWLGHIDGDALPSWAEMPGKRLGAEIIYEQILKKYPLPHSVSVVEAELTEIDAYVDRRKTMFNIVRKIYALDNVELASHTYSHPFNWDLVRKQSASGGHNLPVKDYVYSSEREVAGTIDFINRELAPPGKQLAVYLWSGNALPLAEDLAVLERLGIPNLNGGWSVATKGRRTMTLLSPMARPVGNYLQVYAPIMNENVFTNDWLGPFDGFQKAAETFEMSDFPRRIKPINVYYHFYSGTKLASMKALEGLYDWSLKQDIFPLYVSDYSRKVPDFRSAGVARYLDGNWQISGLGNVRSLRILGKERWPDIANSQGIAGARKLHDGVYVHTQGLDRVRFSVTGQKPQGVYLVSSNGRLLRWDNRADALTLRVRAEVPAIVELGGEVSVACELYASGQSYRGKKTKANTIIFKFASMDSGNARLNCPA